jgi:hypothetical protein
MMDFKASMQWYENAVSLATDQFMARAMRNPSERLYLWCERGDIAAAADNPGDMSLVYAGHIPMDRDRTGVRAWVWEKCRNAPCLPGENT